MEVRDKVRALRCKDDLVAFGGFAYIVIPTVIDSLGFASHNQVMQSLSLDLRQRIVAALEAGQKRAGIAQRFDVSESSVYRLQRQWQRERNLSPKKRQGPAHQLPPQELPALQELMDEQIAKQRDPATLVVLWQERTGKRIGLSTMHRALHRLKLSFKKSAASPRNATKKSEQPLRRR